MPKIQTANLQKSAIRTGGAGMQRTMQGANMLSLDSPSARVDYLALAREFQRANESIVDTVGRWSEREQESLADATTTEWGIISSGYQHGLKNAKSKNEIEELSRTYKEDLMSSYNAQNPFVRGKTKQYFEKMIMQGDLQGKLGVADVTRKNTLMANKNIAWKKRMGIGADGKPMGLNATYKEQDKFWDSKSKYYTSEELKALKQESNISADKFKIETLLSGNSLDSLQTLSDDLSDTKKYKYTTLNEREKSQNLAQKKIADIRGKMRDGGIKSMMDNDATDEIVDTLVVNKAVSQEEGSEMKKMINTQGNWNYSGDKVISPYEKRAMYQETPQAKVDYDNYLQLRDNIYDGKMTIQTAQHALILDKKMPANFKLESMKRLGAIAGLPTEKKAMVKQVQDSYNTTYLNAVPELKAKARNITGTVENFILANKDRPLSELEVMVQKIPMYVEENAQLSDDIWKYKMTGKVQPADVVQTNINNIPIVTGTEKKQIKAKEERFERVGFMSGR